jgi:hypothetical protein
MTDRIYYKVQYPFKKAINVIKDIEPDSEGDYHLSTEEREKISDFIDKWETGAKSDLKALIRKLRQG